MLDDFGADIARAFFRWDVDEDGRIDRFEFQGLVEELAPARAEEASLTFDEMDSDDDKMITFDEFEAWWTR